MWFHSRIPLQRIRPVALRSIKPSALGDIIHSLPVLEALRIRFPEAHICWVVNRSYEPLIQGHPALNSTLPFDRQVFKRGLLATLRTAYQFAQEVRKRRFDLVIDLQGLLRTGLMTLATCSPRRVGMGTAREGSRYCYTDVIPTPDSDKEHAIDRYWRIAEALGVGDLPKRFRIPIPESARFWVDSQLQSCPRPWTMFAVGSRWLTKRWPPDSFAALAQRAQNTYGGTAIFIGAAR